MNAMFKKPVDIRFMKKPIISGIVYEYFDLLYQNQQIQNESIPGIYNLAKNEIIENYYNQPIS